MLAETVGRWTGKAWIATRKAIAGAFVRRCLIVAAIVYALPPATQYWLSHVPVPEVPVSAIVAMFAAALMLLSFAAVVYVAFHFARAIGYAEQRVVMAPGAPARPPIIGPVDRTPSDGSFTAPSDQSTWAKEQLEVLKRKGILTETDRMDILNIEQLAEEMGVAQQGIRDARNGVKRAE